VNKGESGDVHTTSSASSRATSGDALTEGRFAGHGSAPHAPPPHGGDKGVHACAWRCGVRAV
jgi:hypothetical protein